MSYIIGTDKIVITGKPDNKGFSKSETLEFVPMPKGGERVKAMHRAIKADQAASTVALSYFLEAATSSDNILSFAAYAVEHTEDDKPSMVLKPESEDLKKKRNAFNKEVRECLAPIVKDEIKQGNPKLSADVVAEEWAAMLAQGSFAQCVSVARKFVAYVGRLPCAYTDQGKPDISRGMSVYAMQAICNQYKPNDIPVGFADKVRKLLADWTTSKERGDISDRAALFSVLNEFTIAAETDYLMASQATTASMLQLNVPADAQVSGLSVEETEELTEEETEQA